VVTSLSRWISDRFKSDYSRFIRLVVKKVPAEVYVIQVNGLPYRNHNRKSSCLYFRQHDAEKQAAELKRNRDFEIEVETYSLVKTSSKPV